MRLVLTDTVGAHDVGDGDVDHRRGQNARQHAENDRRCSKPLVVRRIGEARGNGGIRTHASRLRPPFGVRLSILARLPRQRK